MSPSCGKVCIKCKELLSLEQFSTRSRQKDRLNYYCKSCNKLIAVPIDLRRRPLKAAKRAVGRAWLNEIKLSAGCADCGFNSHPAALDFDHRPGEVKDFNISNKTDYDRDLVLAEIAKCDVVCSNCHRIRTATRAGW